MYFFQEDKTSCTVEVQGVARNSSISKAGEVSGESLVSLEDLVTGKSLVSGESLAKGVSFVLVENLAAQFTLKIFKRNKD